MRDIGKRSRGVRVTLASLSLALFAMVLLAAPASADGPLTVPSVPVPSPSVDTGDVVIPLPSVDPGDTTPEGTLNDTVKKIDDTVDGLTSGDGGGGGGTDGGSGGSGGSGGTGGTGGSGSTGGSGGSGTTAGSSGTGTKTGGTSTGTSGSTRSSGSASAGTSGGSTPADVGGAFDTPRYGTLGHSAVEAASRARHLAGPFAAPLLLAIVAIGALIALARGSDRLVKIDTTGSQRQSYRL